MSNNSLPREETPFVASAITSAVACPVTAIVTTALTVVTIVLTIVTVVLTVAIIILAVVPVTTNGELDARLDVKKKSTKEVVRNKPT